MKTCVRCELPKPNPEFKKHSSGSVRNVCRPCCSAQKKDFYRANKEEILAANRKNYEARRAEIILYYKEYRKKNRKRMAAYAKDYNRRNADRVLARNRKSKYGISPEEYRRLLIEQGGVCAICERLGGKKGLGVDHDHESGKVRALLCSTCNSAIGLLHDSSALVLKASEYLAGHGK